MATFWDTKGDAEQFGYLWWGHGPFGQEPRFVVEEIDNIAIVKTATGELL